MFIDDKVRWKKKECGVRCGVQSVENAECGKCGGFNDINNNHSITFNKRFKKVLTGLHDSCGSQ